MERSPWIAMGVGLAVAVLLWTVRGGEEPSERRGDEETAPRDDLSPASVGQAARRTKGASTASRAMAALVRLAPRAQRTAERDSAHRARMRLLDQLQARSAQLGEAARGRVWAVFADLQDSYGDPESTCAPRGESDPSYDQAQCLEQLLDVLAEEARERLYDAAGDEARRFDDGFIRSVVIAGRLGVFAR